MTFRKYVCKSCFKLFIKNALIEITECPKCGAGPIAERGDFERKQPFPRTELIVTTDKIDCVPFRREQHR